MSRTIGRRWPKNAPAGDFVCMCDICGVNYRYSQLRRRRDSLLACQGPGTNRCGKERSSLALNEANIAQSKRTQLPVQRGGNYSKPAEPGEFPHSFPFYLGGEVKHRTTLEDIYE